MNICDGIEKLRQFNQSAKIQVKVGPELYHVANIKASEEVIFARDAAVAVLELAEPTLIVPILNMNGTSREELVDQRRNVFDALGEAHRLLAEASPHGRDYQHDPSGEMFKAATKQHRRRRLLIEALRDELRDEVLAIM